MSILAILMMVLTIGTSSGLEGNNQHDGGSVEVIYQNIEIRGLILRPMKKRGNE